jgi:hypothetical protein
MSFDSISECFSLKPSLLLHLDFAPGIEVERQSQLQAEDIGISLQVPSLVLKISDVLLTEVLLVCQWLLVVRRI